MTLLDTGAGLSARDWTFDPSIALPLLVSGVWYACGLVALRKHAPRSRQRSQAVAFAAGWLTLLLALLSPLHEASEQIFSAHMIQHELLMAVAAPLLVLARPIPVFLWALPIGTRRRVAAAFQCPSLQTPWRVLTRPFDAWLLHGAVIWIWHIPLLFESTLHSEVAHAAQHVSFLGSALIFWWALTHGQRRSARGMSIVYLFTTAVHTGVLGALMTFSRTPWYPEYASGAAAWGMTPESDQQLAGLLMWIPASVAYLIGALALMRQWLSDSDRAVNARSDRPSPPSSQTSPAVAQ